MEKVTHVIKQKIKVTVCNLNLFMNFISSFYFFIPTSNEPSDCLQAFGDCREGLIPRSLLRCKFDAPSACCGVFDFQSSEISFRLSIGRTIMIRKVKMRDDVVTFFSWYVHDGKFSFVLYDIYYPL
ncbi:MAG: hypothetical protein NC407_12935 [Lachnoclostridium sp.]|nr:hypothetical protein [Lachnoclostridium sp.]